MQRRMLPGPVLLAGLALSVPHVAKGREASPPETVALDVDEVQDELTLGELDLGAPPARSSPTTGTGAWLELAGSYAVADRASTGSRRRVEGGLLVGLPLGGLPSSRRTSERGAPSSPPPLPEATRLAVPSAPTLKGLPEPPARPVEEGPARPYPLDSMLLRETVAAALRCAHPRQADPDALSATARRAALLPEVKLRASRVVDSSQSLSPTVYDPSRTTSTGGDSLTFEARLSWRLDQALFPQETVSLWRLREERSEEDARLARRVAAMLLVWERATLEATSPAEGSLDTDEARLASLRAHEQRLVLDLLTNGWFSKRVGARDLP